MRAEGISGPAAHGFEHGSERGEAALGLPRTRQVYPPSQWILLSAGLLAAVALFVFHDYSRLMKDADTQVRLTSRYLATELADADADTAPALLNFLLKDVPPGLDIYLLSEDGRIVAATGGFRADGVADAARVNGVSASAATPGVSQQILVSKTRNRILQPLWLDAGIAAGLAAMLMLASWRRRRPLTEEFSAGGTAVRFVDLVDALPFGLARWSTHGELVSCNTKYRDALMLDARDVRPGADYVRMMNKVTRGYEWRLVSEENAGRTTELSRNDATLLLDERPLAGGGFLAMVSDVSAHRAAARMLEDARAEHRLMAQRLQEETLRAEAACRAKTSFLAHLSHDVRTPLNHIIGFADLIAHQTYGAVGDKRYLNYINNIKTSGENLLASFSAILELAQIEGGQFTLRRDNVDVADILKSVSNRFQDHARRAGLTFDLSLPEHAMVYVDRICVERMLGNLVENAIQFTPSGGRIKVAAWAAEDGAVLEVSDTGIGISEERMNEISQPFVLGNEAFARNGAGVGVGIAIARAIAELSGGALAIDTSPAVGTTVAVSLPTRAARAKAIATAA